MTDKIEMVPEQRMAFYAVEQWREILDAYVRSDEKNPLLVECLERFEVYGADSNMPEDENGFLHSAMRAVGEDAYWRLLEPLAEPMSKFCDEAEQRADFEYDAKKLRGLIHDFREFCRGEGGHDLLHIRCLLDFGMEDETDFDPIFYAYTTTALLWAYSPAPRQEEARIG
ncbi:MAG: hypothetical protein WA733_20425 [Methylocystis sp.]|jgi:hypothetical protein